MSYRNIPPTLINKLFTGNLLLISVLFSCNLKHQQKEEQISINNAVTLNKDSLTNYIQGNMALNKIATNPNAVILTGLADHRLVTGNLKE